MVTTRRRAPLHPPPPPPSPPPPLPSLSPPALSTPPSLSDYEKSRDERIKENLQRMQNLGILNLSLQLKSATNRSRKRTSAAAAIDRPSLPQRRSSRLQSISPISYSENDVVENGWIREGKGEEVYSEEDEKLLGWCDMGWTLFVDGCGEDGKRIYDQINGKTCHQCRQKTLGHRTSCSRCKIVQGQFCGDCLFMRYGENVLEVNKNPNWICPACRGICNCSICRVKRGWAPTGHMYKKVVSLGYKSVAHYLIQTRRLQTNLADCSSVEPVSAKKSLIFTDAENHTELGGVNSSSNENIANSSAEKSGSENSDENSVNNVVNTSTGITRSLSKVTEADATIEPRPDSIASRPRKRHKI